MDIVEAKRQIQISKDVIKLNAGIIKGFEQEIAEYLCPFIVGEKVLDGKGVHHIVASISYYGYGRGYDIKVFKIRNNGTPYKESSYPGCIGEYTKDLTETSGD